MICKMCKFFQEVYPDNWGRCHRYAPQPILADNAEEWVWPPVGIDDFCGEYQIDDTRLFVGPETPPNNGLHRTGESCQPEQGLPNQK